MGHGDGAHASSGIATPRNAAGQQGVMGNDSCPSCVSSRHGHNVDGPSSLQDLPELMRYLRYNSLPTESSGSTASAVPLGLPPPYGGSWGREGAS